MYTGLTAKLELKAKGDSAAATVAYISNWSVEETRDVIEIVRLGEKAKEKVPAGYSWSASAEGTADFSDASAQSKFREAMLSGDKVSVTFFLNDTTKLTGNAYVESFSLDISAEDKGNISISLNGDGELQASFATAAQ